MAGVRGPALALATLAWCVLPAACVVTTDGGACWSPGDRFEYEVMSDDPMLDWAVVVVCGDNTRVQFPDGSWIEYRSLPK